MLTNPAVLTPNVFRWLIVCVVFALVPQLNADESDKPVLVEAKRIWDKAPHNAFTDLLRHKGRWYCVFREGSAHVSPDGALRVITSRDGETWESIALITSPKYDLRDAKITVTPNGRLMLNGAGMIADADVRYYSMVWFSDDDGHTWDEGRQIGDDGFWLWRTQWHDGAAYSMGYSTERDRETRRLRLYRSATGAEFETHVKSVGAYAGCGEDKILFRKDESALCLLRHETGDRMGQLGTSVPPYTDWKWRDLNKRIGGPNMLQLPDGRIIAATRLYDGGARTSLSWLDPEKGTLTEVLRLPSGGDTSYAGMVLHNGLLWVSYYSSHEDKTSIYLAKVKLPLKPHPDAVGNIHPPEKVDNPALVPFVVRDKQELPGIVLDETDATLIGNWQYSTHTPPYVGLGYLHDQKSGKGERSVTFRPDLPAAGLYEVRLSHCYNVRRSTNTPVTIHHADGESLLRINQQDVPEHDKLFRTLGTFRFAAGQGGWVKISNDGTDGKYVIADAVQFLPVDETATSHVLEPTDGIRKAEERGGVTSECQPLSEPRLDSRPSVHPNSKGEQTDAKGHGGREREQRSRHPNIVYILADDLGYGDVSCYNSESKITTPNVDRLAAEGMRFTDAHTPSAVCTPTRYGILTGRYCWRTRLKYRVLDGLDPPLIEADRMTVPKLLQQHGYATGCVGKWHLGMQWTDRDGQPVPAVPYDTRGRPRVGADVDYTVPFTGGPTAVGFDWYFGISASLNMSPFCFLQNDRPVRLPVLHQERIATEFVSVDEGVRSPDFTIAGVMPRLAGEAVGFIERQAERPDQPFFLYAPLTSPHLPLAPNEEYRGKSNAGHYGDFVVETDAFVGAVLEALDRTGQAESTIVIFTSDNGGLYHYWEPQEADDLKHYKVRSRGAYVQQFGHQGNAHLRGTKADIWEGGHRVPFVVRWPGQTPAGAVSNELIELTDLLATCAALLGTDLPEGAGPDSRNALPALLTAAPKARVRDYAVHHSLWGKFAIRKGDWKLIPQRGSGGFTFPKEIDVEKVGGPPGQLYNLAADPSETKNLWDNHPDVVAELSELLQAVKADD